MNNPPTPLLRRIVTGHDAHGQSIVSLDGTVPTVFKLPVVDVVFQELWNTRETPCKVDNAEDPTVGGQVVLPPPKHGTRFRVIDMPPDSAELMGQDREAMSELFAQIGDRKASSASRHPAMHRTESIDYGMVLDGEITLILDTEERQLKAGDVVIQRGTNHAWANRSDRPCRMLFVLIDGVFEG